MRGMKMQGFILEEQLEKVVDLRIKTYLSEVVSCYNSGNYRGAVVVLYTTVIFDLLRKLKVMKDIYNDKGAEEIIANITKQQADEPKNPAWEGDLIEKVYNKTKLITLVEKEELLYIKTVRNYAAHPIVKIDSENDELELKEITKETAKDLIRKAFEILFLRDAILAKEVTDEFCKDLNEFYNRVKTDGLEGFLKTKYFHRMTQERKDDLFKALWKFVFVLTNDDCDKNRKSNFWGLLYLHNENKNHYNELIKCNENYYFGKLELETFKGWLEQDKSNVNYFNTTSRIMNLIEFVVKSPDIYKIFNEYAKNIITQSINHMYTDCDVTKTTVYNCSDEKLFERQVIIKACSVFLSQDIQQHFKMIFKMINNYMHTKCNWTESSNYCVFKERELEKIYCQCEYLGYEKEYIEFLIEYCMGAEKYSQAPVLFEYLLEYNDRFDKSDFYHILTKMNDNSQYYKCFDMKEMLNKLEDIFTQKYSLNLVNTQEEKFLYSNLYPFDPKQGYKLDEVLKLLDDRAKFYCVYNLWTIIEKITDNNDKSKLQQETNSESYPQIISILSNKNDWGYNEYYIKSFKNWFE